LMRRLTSLSFGESVFDFSFVMATIHLPPPS
jgi:hypothetical protein